MNRIRCNQTPEQKDIPVKPVDYHTIRCESFRYFLEVVYLELDKKRA